jgi:hypothetical protein
MFPSKRFMSAFLAIALVSPLLRTPGSVRADPGESPGRVAWAEILHLGPTSSAQAAIDAANHYGSDKDPDPDHKGFKPLGRPYAIVALGVSQWYHDVIRN